MLRGQKTSQGRKQLVDVALAAQGGVGQHYPSWVLSTCFFGPSDVSEETKMGWVERRRLRSGIQNEAACLLGVGSCLFGFCAGTQPSS